MRAISLDDLVLAARQVESFPVSRQKFIVSQWIDEAHAADKYRKKFGNLHPIWGSGSLGSRVSRSGLGRSVDPTRLAFRAALIVVLQAVEARGA